jgi:hypothetical protein
MALTAAQAFELYGSTELKADTRKDDFLAEAARRVDADVFGDAWGSAVGLMALHLMALAPLAASAVDAAHRGVNSTSAEGLSISFGALPSGKSESSEWLKKTGYGQQYLALRLGRPKLYAQIVPVTAGPRRRRW